MARYDKYDPKVGGFRAALAADFNPEDLGKVLAVGLDADGQVVTGLSDNSGVSGLVGVLVLTKKKLAGDIVDVMTSGEIVDVELAPGTVYFGAVNGTVSDVESTYRVGHTVEDWRLIVRFQHLAANVPPGGDGEGEGEGEGEGGPGEGEGEGEA